YCRNGRPFLRYSSRASTNRTLATSGYLGAHSRAPVRQTLSGLALKKAFEFANALANIFTCGNVLSKCENVLGSHTAAGSSASTCCSQFRLLNTERNMPPRKSNEIFGFTSSINFISPLCGQEENGTISFGKLAVSKGCGQERTCPAVK